MNKLRVIFALLILAGCAQTGAPGDSTQTSTDASLPLDAIQKIADEFKNLRVVKGHFDGGEWNDDVDQWMGRKHQLMIQLGERLGTGEYNQSQVIQALSQPDVIARETDDLYKLVSDSAEFTGPITGFYELLIYYWRGEHDFLYFTVQNGRITTSGWWYAGE